jgi:nitroreductase
LLNKVLEAGTFAANGGNMQSWRFLVIRDPRDQDRCRDLVQEGVA